MKVLSIIRLSLLLAAAACGNEKSKEKKPEVIPSPKVEMPVTPLTEEKKPISRSTVFTVARNLEIEAEIKKIGCKITYEHGVADCPMPSTIESLDYNIALLNMALTAAQADEGLKIEFEKYQLIHKTTLAEIHKQETSPTAKDATKQMNKARLSAFLNRNLIGDGQVQFTFAQKIKGTLLFAELSNNPEFGQLLINRGINLLIISNKTVVESFLAVRSLKVSFEDTADTIIDALKSSPAAGKKDPSKSDVARDTLYFNRNITFASSLSEDTKVQGVERLNELKENEIFEQNMVRLKVGNVVISSKTELTKILGQTYLSIDASSTSAQILDELTRAQ